MRQTVLVLLMCCVAAESCRASVLVLTNRTHDSVSFRLITEPASKLPAPEIELEQGDCLPIPLASPAKLLFLAAGKRKEYQVRPTALYYFFLNDAGQTDIGQIGLATPPVGSYDPPLVGAKNLADDVVAGMPTITVVPVKILFDDAELLTRATWEARMRKRFEEVSRIFRKQCFTEFRIVAVESWHGATSTHSLSRSMEEFENAVDPAPARVAIGFLAPRIKKPEDGHLGGTRGPLSKHVLVHEWVNENTDRERLELLVHELGHFLGAVHSPEVNSVMRPKLGDRFARSAKFRIVFDPLNTLAMCLVSHELGVDRTIRFDRLNPWTKIELRRLYYSLDRANPQDPAASQYLRVLDSTSLRLGGPAQIFDK